MDTKEFTHRLVIQGSKEAIDRAFMLAAVLTMDAFGNEPLDLKAEVIPAKATREKARVKYVARVGKDILEALGDKTVRGILFGHVLNAGENGVTASGLRKITGYTEKSVQSGLDKLQREDGYIISVPLTDEELGLKV